MAARDVEIMPGETAIKWVEFHPRLVFKHLDQSIVVTDKRVVVRVPRTVFSVFILGYFERSVTWDNVDTVVSGRGVDSKRLVVGSIILLFALMFFFSGWGVFLYASTGLGMIQALLTLVILLIGLLVILSAFGRVVGVISSSGQSLLVEVGGTEVIEMEDLAALLKVVSAQRTEPTVAPASGNGTGGGR
ncbi:hypothetical protein CEY15_16805 [Dietzia natronolimnaea]|uniref:Uncharacterized protein n=2 Tax=Dietzia natronolimnaea TaxID=161920 RepID=A0A2A2WKU3_9ACTN|nr:hypothetical protein CEY15_16805 [Dietzia natronolimnaea]